jgi:PAS domain S-box-containing protein
MGISRDITPEISLQQEYESLINILPDIIYSTNKGGYFTFVNKATKTILGYEPNEVIGVLFSDLIYEPYQEKVRTHYQQHFIQKQKQSYLEFQVIKKDGSLLWVGQHVSTKFNAIHKDQIDGFHGVVRDIDKQKKNELLLVESEEKYRELFDTSTDLIQSIDLSGNFLYVNNAWKTVVGYNDEEIKKLNLFSIIHPDSLLHCIEIFDQIKETGELQKTNIIYQLVAKNGRIITLEGAISLKTQSEKIISVQTFLRDVTQQKEIEKKLVEREKTLSQITETLADVFYLYNIIEKKYEYISPNCEDVLGANSTFFYAGKSHTEHFCDAEDIKIIKEANKNVDAGKPYNIEFRIHVDKKLRWINEISYPIFDEEGNIVANSGICRDITDLKSATATINRQNVEIRESILYAKRLQDAVLPNAKNIQEILPDSFVLYKPKAVVSGDFYVVDYLNTDEANPFPTFIVGDCTGHGVPGAVLSLMCNVLVRESFIQKNVNSPAEALGFVRNRLIKFFKADNDKRIQDGMDISFCVLNTETNQLYFSGAYNSCIILRDNIINEYRGDKQHVGYNDNPKPFNNHIIDVKSGDQVFLYTDGYMDQFGGKYGKKYTKKKLHQLLLDNAHLPMKDIKTQMDKEFVKWKKNLEQIDDVTVLGLRIK